MKTDKPKKRCAVYTRKSTDEGLDQDFNSLDAQREAAEHHIRAQAHEGWMLLPDRYDDGGFSGGTIDRPGVRRLIQDIESGLIDVVVVYKIDRLSRSMADFMKLMELFEKHSVSFVSVTQHFNTDTSMGRLTLNILQSFAQFEREMTAERIRDKFAASKRKGMWMGGPPPLGYDVRSRKLIINTDEAEVVQYIFNRFLQLGSTTLLVKDLAEKGYQSKNWVSQRGRHHQGGPLTKSNLYKILQNPTYIGKVRHKGQVYEGEHDGIVDPKTFEKVQDVIEGRVPNFPVVPRTKTPYLLQGIIFDAEGFALTTGASKKEGKRYRYYVSTKAVKRSYADCPLKTVSAPLLEEVVVDQVRRLLSRPEWALRILKKVQESGKVEGINERSVLHAIEQFDLLWEDLFPAEQRRLVHLLIERITVYPDKVQISLRPLGMTGLLHEIMPDVTFPTGTPSADGPVTIEIPILLKKRGGRKYITAPDGRDIVSPKTPQFDNSMMRAVIRGFEFLEKLDEDPDMTIMRMAEQEQLDHAYIAKAVRITQLAPDIIEAILNGRQPKGLTLSQLMRPFPDGWNEQRGHFGFGAQ